MKSELDFLFVRSNVLVDLFLKFDAKLNLLLELLSELTVVTIDVVEGELQLFFIQVELADLSIEFVLF